MRKKLSSIGEIILGHSFRGAIVDDPKGDYLVLQAKNVGPSGIDRKEKLSCVTLAGTRTRAIVQREDIILTNRGTFRAAVFNDAAEKLVAASSTYIIRVLQPEEVLPQYITIFLNSREGQALLSTMNRGSLIQSLTRGNLEMLEVPVPALETQQQIIAIHRNYQARAALYRRHSQLADAIANQAISILISQ